MNGPEQLTVMTREERRVLDDYVVAVRAHFGNRLLDVFVFGSRARGAGRQ